MALIKETAEWVENIYLIEPNDPVEGGEDGVDNRPHIELANRTAFLNKKRQEQEQNLQAIDKKLTQEIKDRTGGDAHLQRQIDGLKEQIAKIVANGSRDSNSPNKDEAVADGKDLSPTDTNETVANSNEKPNSPNKGETVVDSDIVITYRDSRGTWRNENSEPPSLTIRSISSSDEKLIYQTNQSSATRQAIDRPPLLSCVATFKYPSDLIISDSSQVTISGTGRRVVVGNVDTFNKTITLSIDLEFNKGEERFNIKIKQG